MPDYRTALAAIDQLRRATQHTEHILMTAGFTTHPHVRTISDVVDDEVIYRIRALYAETRQLEAHLLQQGYLAGAVTLTGS